MPDLHETINAAMNPATNPTTFVELERWVEQNPRKCGNCIRRKGSCPEAYVDVDRMVRVFSQPDNDPCQFWSPVTAYEKLDQAFVLAKLAHNLR